MNAVEEARARLDAAEYRKARDLALEGLAGRPDDADLLRIAGLAGLETGAGDAVVQLRRVTELRPEQAESWHELGEALVTEGRTDEAADAFRRAVELDPEDEVALTHLGHVSHQRGDSQAAMSFLARAADREGGYSTAAMSLIDLYRSVGQHEEALAAARRVAEADPDDVLAALDVGELSLLVGDHEGAVAGFERVREIDYLGEHDVYVLHALIHVEIRRQGWERALELARDAVAVDPMGRTAELIRFLESQTGASSDEDEAPVPTQEEVEAALESSHAEHRRLHADDRRTEGGENLG